MTTKLSNIVRTVSIGAIFLVGCSFFSTSVIGQAANQMKNSEIIQRLVPVTGDTQRTLDLAVGFKINSATLTKRAQLQLDELAAALLSKELAEVKFEIYGHTDRSGTAELNIRLSKSRAEAVVTYLTDYHQVPRKRFVRIEGFGHTKLIPGLLENSPQHRRVEIVALYKENNERSPQKTPKSPVAVN